MNLIRYLRQTVSHEPVTGRNEWGEATYGTPQTLQCRKVKRTTTRLGPEGRQFMSSGNVTTIEEITPGDLLDGEEVITQENMVDRRGRVLGWVSYLE